MRLLLSLAALLLLTTFAPPELAQPWPNEEARLFAEPILLDPRDQAVRQAGRLVFLGGWHLRSDNFRFGGISAMHVEGGEVTALSDAGDVLRFSLPRAGTAQKVRIFRLPGSQDRHPNVDAEAMALNGRTLWVGLEKQRSVWRYRLPDWSLQKTASPPAMQAWRPNRGLEAMLRLPDGRFLLFEEGVRADGTSELLVFAGDPVEEEPLVRLRYRPPSGYRITDAALLPDGRAVFLNRRLGLPHGISAKVTLARLNGLAEEMTVAGEEIAHLRRPLSVDNMEALSITQEQGRTILWIASDDNFNPLQRTLLMKFALAG
jgi:hypothetical protein